jgi:hypothetical protein
VDALDEDIRHKVRLLRMSLRLSAVEHEKRAAKGKSLLAAIDDFLGDRTNGSKASPPAEYGLLTDAVRSVLFVLDAGETFTVEKVEKGYAGLENAPAADRQRISIVLWKMAEQGELEIVERGAGRKPTIYKVRMLKIMRYKRE